jgi:hypothetical protein
MTQAKKSSSQPSAKLAMDSTRTSAENVVKIGSNAMKEFMATSADEAQKAQDKVFAMSRESAENFAKSADAVTKMMYEMIGMSRDNVETYVECGNMAASMAKDVTSEIFESTNQAFSDTVEMSREIFGCCTANDVLELQNRMLRSAIDNFFNQSMKLSGMMFEYTTEALEPLNERVAQATEQFSKAIAA